MGSVRRHRLTWIVAASAVLGWPMLLQPAGAQFPFSNPSRFELSDAVDLPKADSAIEARLDQVRASLANEQWNEAVETLRQIMDTAGDRVKEFTPGRYLNVRDYCHAQLAACPAEALELYRGRVDPLAKKWYDEGVAARDIERLQAVVAQFFASSWGDDALLALGDLALEQGDPSRARGYWERIVEEPPEVIAEDFFARVRQALPADDPQSALLDRWYVAEEIGAAPLYLRNREVLLPDATSRELVRFWKARGLPPVRLAYPETDLAPAAVRARLVLASILEGDRPRAERELAAIAERDATATGRLAGREVNFGEWLSTLLAASAAWQSPASPAQWTTFGGSPHRNQTLPWALDVGSIKWRLGGPPGPIEVVKVNDASQAANLGLPPRRPAEDNNALLSYHPVVSGDLLLLAGHSQIFAFDVHTGQPAFSAAAGRPPGEIFYEKQDQYTPFPNRLGNCLGAPRYTLTIDGDLLIARLGSPVTAAATEMFQRGASRGVGGFLVVLDLAAEGRLVRKIASDDSRLAFEGTPLAAGGNLYVGMRHADATKPRAYVACYDIDTGRLRWRQHVCAAETPARGQLDECTHNLLTLHDDTLFYNSNLGAVAALDADDGRLRWVTLYRRSPSGDVNRPGAHMYRDLTPCVYDKGRLFVAPADSEQILCLDAESGALRWQTAHADDTVHLLGVGGGNLIATGDRVWWIDVATGKTIACWPELMQPSPRGYGRGVLLGDAVYFPTRTEIHVLRQSPNAEDGLAFGQPIALREEEGRACQGGNLLATEGYLLIAGAEELVALSQYGKQRREYHQREITARPHDALPRYQLARCDEGLADFDAAVAGYRAAIELAQPDDRLEGRAVAELAAERLFELLGRRAEDYRAALDWSRAAVAWDEAALAAPVPGDACEALVQAAESCRRAGDFAAAVERWQLILADGRLAPLLVPASDGHRYQARWLATEGIEKLIAAHGRQTYARVEAAAEDAVARDGDVESLWRALATYPHARAVVWAILYEARRLAEQGKSPESERIARRLAGAALAAEERLRARAMVAAALEGAGDFAAARRAWRRLASEFPAESARGLMLPGEAVADGAPDESVAACVARRLGRPEYAAATGGATEPLRRRWQREFPADLIVPAGEPSHPDRRSLLLVNAECQMLDERSGEPRWRLTLSAAPHWAAYHGDGVLVAAGGEVLRVSLASSEVVWRATTDHSVDWTGELCRPVLSGDRLHVRTATGIAALDVESGAEIWKYAADESQRIEAILANERGGLWVLAALPRDEGTAASYDAIELNAEDGAAARRGRAELTAPPRECVAFPGDRLLLRDDNGLTMLDAASGGVAWRRDLPRVPALDSRVLVDDDRLVVAAADGGLSRIDLRNGGVLWSHAPKIPASSAPNEGSFGPGGLPAAIDESAAYCVSGGTLRAFALADGATLWTQPLADAERRCRLQTRGDLLLASIAGDGSEGEATLAVVSSADGRFVQQLRFRTAGAADVRPAGSAALVGGDRRWWLVE